MILTPAIAKHKNQNRKQGEEMAHEEPDYEKAIEKMVDYAFQLTNLRDDTIVSEKFFELLYIICETAVIDLNTRGKDLQTLCSKFLPYGKALKLKRCAEPLPFEDYKKKCAAKRMQLHELQMNEELEEWLEKNPKHQNFDRIVKDGISALEYTNLDPGAITIYNAMKQAPTVLDASIFESSIGHEETLPTPHPRVRNQSPGRNKVSSQEQDLSALMPIDPSEESDRSPQTTKHKEKRTAESDKRPFFEPEDSARSRSDSPIEATIKSPSRSPSRSPSKSRSKSPRRSASRSPSRSPTRSPSRSPSRALTKSPAKSPLKSPVKTSAVSPAKTPAISPVKLSRESRSVSPVRSPTKSPAPARTENVVKSPTKSPVKSPITSSFSKVIIPWVRRVLTTEKEATPPQAEAEVVNIDEDDDPGPFFSDARAAVDDQMFFDMQGMPQDAIENDFQQARKSGTPESVTSPSRRSPNLGSPPLSAIKEHKSNNNGKSPKQAGSPQHPASRVGAQSSAKNVSFAQSSTPLHAPSVASPSNPGASGTEAVKGPTKKVSTESTAAKRPLSTKDTLPPKKAKKIAKTKEPSTETPTSPEHETPRSKSYSPCIDDRGSGSEPKKRVEVVMPKNHIPQNYRPEDPWVLETQRALSPLEYPNQGENDESESRTKEKKASAKGKGKVQPISKKAAAVKKSMTDANAWTRSSVFNETDSDEEKKGTTSAPQQKSIKKIRRGPRSKTRSPISEAGPSRSRSKSPKRASNSPSREPNSGSPSPEKERHKSKSVARSKSPVQSRRRQSMETTSSSSPGNNRMRDTSSSSPEPVPRGLDSHHSSPQKRRTDVFGLVSTRHYTSETTPGTTAVNNHEPNNGTASTKSDEIDSEPDRTIKKPRFNARRPVRLWTNEETQALLQGIKDYGTSWANIKHNDEREVLIHRTQVDLKDKARLLRGGDRYAGHNKF